MQLLATNVYMEELEGNVLSHLAKHRLVYLQLRQWYASLGPRLHIRQRVLAVLS